MKTACISNPCLITKKSFLGFRSDAWLFDFGTHVWTPMPDTAPHARPGCAIVGRDVVIIGSYWWGNQYGTDVFNLDTSTWSPAENYPLGGGGQATVPYANNTFLSFGGYTHGLVMEWIPATKGWKFRNESAIAEAMYMPTAFMVPPEIAPCQC